VLPGRFTFKFMTSGWEPEGTSGSSESSGPGGPAAAAGLPLPAHHLPLSFQFVVVSTRLGGRPTVTYVLSNFSVSATVGDLALPMAMSESDTGLPVPPAAAAGDAVLGSNGLKATRTTASNTNLRVRVGVLVRNPQGCVALVDEEGFATVSLMAPSLTALGAEFGVAPTGSAPPSNSSGTTGSASGSGSSSGFDSDDGNSTSIAHRELASAVSPPAIPI
jgi:hypothetical protein